MQNLKFQIQNSMGRAGLAPAMRLSDAAILQTVAYANRRADPGKKRRGQDSNLQWNNPNSFSKRALLPFSHLSR